MCTVLLLRRPGHAWPLLLAANRDERLDRPWEPPAAHWPDRPGVIGGRDTLAGGTWMAMNGAGVVACVLNRPGSLGPAAGKRSRGELPLLALDAADAAAGAARLAALPAADWRPFQLVLADSRGAFFCSGDGAARVRAEPLAEGLSMVTALPPNDPTSPRTRRHLPRFRRALPPDPEAGDWREWEALLGDSDLSEGHAATLNVPARDGFGTVCQSLLALAADGRRVWRFAAPPGAAFQAVAGAPG